MDCFYLLSFEIRTTLCCLQGWNALQEIALGLGKKKISKPPCGAETRWAGLLPMLAWVNQHKIFLMEYTAPNDCVVNPDGTAYNTHHIEVKAKCTVSVQAALRVAS